MSAGLFAGRQFSEVSIWALCIPFIYVVIKKQGIDNNTHNNDHMCIYIYIYVLLSNVHGKTIFITQTAQTAYFTRQIRPRRATSQMQIVEQPVGE